MENEKIKLSHALIKTGIIHIISVVSTLFIPSPMVFLLSFILCVVLGLWIFKGCDLCLIFCCFTATLTGAVFYIATRFVVFLLLPEALTEFVKWVSFFTMAMAVPMMSSMYFASAVTEFATLGTDNRQSS
ncbi:MAG: hypothetical protein IJX15_04550 [Ruminiclostridium sp.]|nr:hypothetical protein [Ruminiclostridium sp.]